jgi:hypothetical protein
MPALKQALFVLITGFLFFQNAHAGMATASDTTVLPGKFFRFIPKGYTLLDMIPGDLNLDKYEDVILVLKVVGEGTSSDSSDGKRPLLILLARPDKTFSLAARNDNIVYCFDCGGFFGDPYNGLEIKKGVFTVHHYGGGNQRWSNDISFKYSPPAKDWFLYKVVDETWSVFNVEKIDSTITSVKDFGKIRFSKYTPE